VKNVKNIKTAKRAKEINMIKTLTNAIQAYHFFTSDKCVINVKH
jgi:hypothetical protein